MIKYPSSISSKLSKSLFKVGIATTSPTLTAVLLFFIGSIPLRAGMGIVGHALHRTRSSCIVSGGFDPRGP